MQHFDFGSMEVRMLWASALLGLVQLVLAASVSTATRGLAWGVGPRDESGKPLSPMSARIVRAFQNWLETFPIFLALVFVAQALDKHTALIALGAQLYFYGRVIYVPLYAFGIPFIRTLSWAVATAGIVIILFGIWPAA